MKISKKGQGELGSLPMVAIIITLFVLILGAGLLSTEKLNDVVKAERGTTNTMDVVTLINGTAVSLTKDELTGITQVTNGTVLLPANYTSDLTTGTITLVDNKFNNTAFNVTYSYIFDNIPYIASNDSMTALGTLGTTWSNPIITMAAIGIMIGVIFSAFAFVKFR